MFRGHITGFNSRLYRRLIVSLFFHCSSMYHKFFDVRYKFLIICRIIFPSIFIRFNRLSFSFYLLFIAEIIPVFSKNFSQSFVIDRGMVATHDVVYYASFLITVPFCHDSSGSRSSYLRYIRAITSLGSSIIPLSGVSLTKNSSKDPPYVTDVTLIPRACSSQHAKIINHETIKVTEK